MTSSYVISPDLEDRIHSGILLKTFPELDSRFLSDSRTDNIDVIEEQLGQNNFGFSMELQNRIFRALEARKPWNLVNVGGDDEDGKDLFGSVTQKINCDTRDILLGTGLVFPFSETYDNEPPDFEVAELKNFGKYGFTSELEMIMSLSAYRCREVIKWKENQYEWVNSRGIKNVITACEHGDPKFFQYKEQRANKVFSPFGNEVLFQPRFQIGSMTHVYHSHEPEFFATFFRYALELGVLDDVMGVDGEKFLKGSHNLPGYLGPYGDAGGTGYMDQSSFLFRVAIPIGGLDGLYRNTHIHSISPNLREGFLEFKIGENKELQIFDDSGKFVIQFLPEDAEYLLKGILHQCSHGHGRTSKKQITELVRFYYSTDFQEQKKDINL
ncbi:hypothetical protein LAT59_04870 [Candidatus Gracilibacteria bacterium]|nr:hypothetical protein [Candidatus Gracilibacteria bacterium]